MTERVTEGETESSCWGQADGVFTPQLLCLSGKKVHELCLVFMLGNYTKQNESDKSSVMALFSPVRPSILLHLSLSGSRGGGATSIQSYFVNCLNLDSRKAINCFIYEEKLQSSASVVHHSKVHWAYHNSVTENLHHTLNALGFLKNPSLLVSFFFGLLVQPVVDVDAQVLGMLFQDRHVATQLSSFS